VTESPVRRLIVGLGETEMEMVSAIQRIKDIGGTTHLFSFYQESGSLLENRPQCPVGHFRRIQLVRYIIDFDYANIKTTKVVSSIKSLIKKGLIVEIDSNLNTKDKHL